MDAIVLAGGLGTRLRSVVSEVPKCMAPVCGKPFLYYLLSYLNKYKEINKVILSVGFLREHIFNWIDENRSQFNFEIDYAIEENPLGTGGGIKLALSKTQAENVLILNGDTFFDVDLTDFLQKNLQHAKEASLSVALKKMEKFDRYGSVTMDGNIIQSFNEKNYCESGLINGGVYIINQKNLDLSDYPEKFSFEKEVLEKLSQEKKIAGFEQNRYFIDIGIPDDYAKANNDFRALFQTIDYSKIKTDGFDTLFLDRDGVINVLRPNDYVKCWDEFVFMPGILEALAKWNKQFSHIFIVTNQRGVGKVVMTEEDLHSVHKKMIEEIEKHGGRIDKIYYCTAVKESDPNRKPNPGMAKQAMNDFPDITPARSLMIGDSKSDLDFARNAGFVGINVNHI